MITLEHALRRYPGRVALFEANAENRWPTYDRRGASLAMLRIAGADYGWANLLFAALLHLPLVRLAVRRSREDEAIDKRPPFCSQACAYADRVGGGVDPVPFLPDRLTEPADLARSQFYRYRGDLTL